MASIDSTSKTAYGSLDWDNYVKGRPTYPQSLKEIIYNHRRAHGSPSWERVVDIGGGVGISSVLCAPDFDKLHLLDPSAANIEKAKVFLADWVSDKNLPTHLEFTAVAAEQAGEALPGAADLVVCATAAHFINPDALVKAAADLLRPGGTLAIYTYWFPIFPDQSQEFQDIFCTALSRTFALAKDEETLAAFATVAPRVCSGKGEGLVDSVPIPKEDFKDPVRVYINPEAQKKTLRNFRTLYPVPIEFIPSRVQDDEEKRYYETGKDGEAEGWSTEVDNKWMHNFLITFNPSGFKLDEKLEKELYGDWDTVFEKECPSGVVRCLWPVNLLLATRK